MELTVDGRKVYAATGGRPFDAAKPLVIFIHGAGLDHTNWQLPARWFAWHGYAALAPDLPGHGRSDGPPLATIPDMAQWIGRLMDAANVERAGLVGHSMGGAHRRRSRCGIARAHLARRPARHGAVHAGQRGPAHRRPRCPRASASDDHRLGAWSARARSAATRRPAFGCPAARWRCSDATGRARSTPPSMPATAGRSGPDAAQRVRCPALVMIGASDSMTPPKIGRALADKIAGSRTVTIPNSGHMMMTEAPDAVLDALIDFFATADAA